MAKSRKAMTAPAVRLQYSEKAKWLIRSISELAGEAEKMQPHRMEALPEDHLEREKLKGKVEGRIRKERDALIKTRRLYSATKDTLYELLEQEAICDDSKNEKLDSKYLEGELRRLGLGIAALGMSYGLLETELHWDISRYSQLERALFEELPPTAGKYRKSGELRYFSKIPGFYRESISSELADIGAAAAVAAGLEHRITKKAFDDRVSLRKRELADAMSQIVQAVQLLQVRQ